MIYTYNHWKKWVGILGHLTLFSSHFRQCFSNNNVPYWTHIPPHPHPYQTTWLLSTLYRGEGRPNSITAIKSFQHFFNDSWSENISTYCRSHEPAPFVVRRFCSDIMTKAHSRPQVLKYLGWKKKNLQEAPNQIRLIPAPRSFPSR